jgi:valyl-tRNA synthetase
VRGGPESVLRTGSGKTKNNPEAFEKVMLESLKLLHPFLPHLTQLLYFSFGQKKPLFFEKWS